MLDNRPAVVENAESQLVSPIAEVEIVVEIWEALGIESPRPLDERSLHRDIGAVEAAPAGLDPLDVRIIELDPMVEPVHERGHPDLPRPADVAEHGDLLGGVAAVPRQVLGDELGLPERV